MKKKIFSLLLIVTMFFGFGVNVKANSDDEISFYELEVGSLNLIEHWEFLEQFIDYNNILEEQEGFLFYGLKENFVNFQIKDLNEFINAKETIVNYSELNGLTFSFIVETDYDNYMYLIGLDNNNELQELYQGLNEGDLIIIQYTVPKEPPFTSFINFIKNLLKDLLKSITDMTMDLINNIWDTNLIDINFVILSDTAIYTGTLNDMLYSVFSIFYVIFAITLVWRILRKVIRKLTFSERW